MANNYCQGATLIPANCFVPEGAQKAFAIYEKLAEDDDFYGVDVEPWLNGSLYVGTGENFDEDAFSTFIDAIVKQGLLVKSFDLELASYCDKLRPHEFGGSYVRVLPSGEVLWFGTSLSNLTDNQLRHLINVRKHCGIQSTNPAA